MEILDFFIGLLVVVSVLVILFVLIELNSLFLLFVLVVIVVKLVSVLVCFFVLVREVVVVAFSFVRCVLKLARLLAVVGIVLL